MVKEVEMVMLKLVGKEFNPLFNIKITTRDSSYFYTIKKELLLI